MSAASMTYTTRITPPRLRRDYPLNLSISVSGGKESKSDSLSSGERKGNSPAHNLPGYQACGDMLRKGKGRLQALAQCVPNYGRSVSRLA